MGNPSGEDRDELLEQYKLAKKVAKQAVAKAKVGAFESMYKALDEKGGERLLFRLAQDREKKSRDLDRVRCIKVESGQVLDDDHQIKGRWQRYFSELLNEGYLSSGSSASSRALSDSSFCRHISMEKVQETLRKMSNRRAVGPDEIPLHL